jgi:HAD superfamily hydrolase (TIGR01509 family)
LHKRQKAGSASPSDETEILTEMQHLAPQLDALIFDYGNTLIEFGPSQVDSCDRALSHALEAIFGAHDFDRLQEIQHRERRAPYAGEFKENDLAGTTRSLIQALFETDASDDQIAELLDVRFNVMVSSIEVDPNVHALLDRLSKRFRLGLISNYPCSRSINHSLAQHGLDRWFETVVVSADVGHVKPHPKLFELAVSSMGVRPEATLYVGDNWLGDIQGAKRFGMKAAWIRQYIPYEDFPENPGDHQPDLVVEHLSELAGLAHPIEEQN